MSASNAGTDLQTLAASVATAILSEDGIERSPDPDSPLSVEIGASTHEVARHFLEQLSHHCTMLVLAIADACSALARLDEATPFAGVVLARGLMEAAADLHWLSDPGLGTDERSRRAVLIYLRQTETQVRNIAAFRKRQDGGEPESPDLEEGIREGWELLKVTAESMASAGHKITTSKKPGCAYSVGDPKPTISALVDEVVADFHGTTALSLYSLYSSVAHAEGEGLGSLLLTSDTIETEAGTRFRRRFDEATWRARIVAPVFSVARDAVDEWLQLALPSRRHALNV